MDLLGPPPAAAMRPPEPDPIQFYTEMQLATKHLLRQANEKRIAQSRYAAPSFADQLGRDLEAPAKNARRRRRDPAATSKSDPGATTAPAPQEDRFSQSADGKRPSRLAGLLGLARPKRRRDDDAPERPPDVSEDRFGLRVIPRPGLASRGSRRRRGASAPPRGRGAFAGSRIVSRSRRRRGASAPPRGRGAAAVGRSEVF